MFETNVRYASTRNGPAGSGRDKRPLTCRIAASLLQTQGTHSAGRCERRSIEGRGAQRSLPDSATAAGRPRPARGTAAAQAPAEGGRREGGRAVGRSGGRAGALPRPKRGRTRASERADRRKGTGGRRVDRDEERARERAREQSPRGGLTYWVRPSRVRLEQPADGSLVDWRRVRRAERDLAKRPRGVHQVVPSRLQRRQVEPDWLPVGRRRRLRRGRE